MLSKDSYTISLLILFIIFHFTTLNNLASANQQSSIAYALERGDYSLNFRIRKEYAKENRLSSANASTIKSTLGYQSSNFYKSYLSLEMINVSSWMGEKYNPNAALAFQRPEYTTINDPKGTGITNANITSEFLPNTEIIFGKQYISLDNARMVGSNPFRQFPISFDALTIKNDYFEDFDIFYSFLSHVNNSNNTLTSEGRKRLRTNLINATWHNFIYGKVVGYLYRNIDLTSASNSNLTVGGRITSDDTFKKVFDFNYEFELANQKNTYRNPNKYSSFYLHINYSKDSAEIFKKWLITGQIGYEHIGSHKYEVAGHVFNFPLGNSHGFNGLAEAYAIMPWRGLKDYYTAIKLEYSDWLDLAGSLHILRFARGPQSRYIGIELDLTGSMQITKQLSSEIVFAILKNKNKSNNLKRFSLSFSYVVL
jgi:hypothetical protein